ncbi:oligosaccharide flippase family protein [Actinoplanes sp. NPDC024001]|uniref:lipopolysaccharide biosynthesis protein n=1 Tax=Actinoplanes sp. NPDC024001 TaxID=3154598 RepID=UPI0033C0D46A
MGPVTGRARADRGRALKGSVRSLLRAVPAAVRRDYAATLLVQWFVLGSGLFLFHMVAQRGGVDGFAYYQIARGVVSTFQPLVTLGLSQALQRYLPRTSSGTDRLARQAILIQAGVAGVFALGGVALSPWLAEFLGIGGGAAAVGAVLIMLTGNCLCTLAAAALRGTHQVARSNTVSAVGLGLVPVIAFALADRIDDFLVLQGSGMVLVAAWGAVTVRRQRPAPPAPHHGADPTMRTLLRYGVRRLPGDIALPALFTYPTFAVAAVLPGSPEAGYVGFTTSAVTLICSFFGMLTPVLLPRLSRLFHRSGKDGATLRMLTSLPVSAAGLAAVAAAVFAVFAPLLVRGFLGPEFAPAVGVLRAGVVAAIPFAMYYAARPTLDALLEAPVMSRLLLACLALEVLLTHVTQSVLAPTYAAVVALCGAAAVLGVCSERLVVRALRTGLS